MPHFILDCSSDIPLLKQPIEILQEIYNTAEETGLFTTGDVKVRLNPFTDYIVGGKKDSFIHVFAYIMEGRTTEQKNNLSKKIVSKLKSMFPDIPIISINIKDFEKSTYCNKTMV
ncbi:5-carboxymethyl-2-hydroxymuconate Delta-isomerase [Flavobacterium sp.]|uniref:5-carboxymethyl-2-hydroxymuconate Delta-isomerase n=1 Tax=Flavobacterium sp. TaxID=239 RepID=UPI003D6B696A